LRQDTPVLNCHGKVGTEKTGCRGLDCRLLGGRKLSPLRKGVLR
jgi:hypothetical protein